MSPGSAGTRNGVGSAKLYRTGSMTTPAHPIVADCGHNNVLNFLIRYLFIALILSKLGLGLQSGASARSVVTSSYVIMVSIFDVVFLVKLSVGEFFCTVM